VTLGELVASAQAAIATLDSSKFVFVSRSPGNEPMPDKSIAATRRLQDIET
jgi:hypothetical protein